MATFNTVKTYALDGTTKQFAITFDYLARNHIVATIVLDDGNRTVLTLGTDYRFTTATQIETTKAWGPADNAVSIELKRQTPADKAVVNFQDGSILRSADLNLSQLQGIYIAEEAREIANEGLSLTIDGSLDARNRKIINVADGVNPKDVINKSQLDNATQTANGWLAAAQNAANAAAASQGAAAQSASNAAGSENQAASDAAKAAQEAADAEAAEQKAAADAAAAQQSNVLAQQAANAANGSQATSAQQAAQAQAQALLAAGYATTATTERSRATQEADRAKAEADKIAAQNVLVDAIKGVGASPDFIVDFKSMPTVNGTDITSSLQGQGFQVNSNLTCGDGGGTNTDKLRDNKFSGHSFMVAKPATVNASTGATSNDAPEGMEYDWAVCNDFYGTWTPTGGTEGRTRVQTIYDKNAIWVRGYHHQDTTWTPWKRVNSQLYTDITGMDADTITSNGDYYYTNQNTTTNVPKIDSPEDSAVYFFSVASDNEQEQIVQTMSSPKTNSQFNRYRVAGTWSQWWNTTATLDVDTAPSGFDYDTTTNPGYWGVDNATALHAPTEVGTNKSILQVFGTADGSTIQTVFCPAKNSTITRMKNTTGSWGGWTKPITTSATSSRIIVEGIDGLSGPLRLGGEAVNDFDAPTFGQLKAATGQTGATMNGVATNFIGAVEWFNGSTAAVPAGYVLANGQPLSRDDYPELWNAVDKKILVSVDDTTWLNAAGTPYVHRGKYSTGGLTGAPTGSGITGAWFRVPDLNGIQTDSLDGVFLSGTAKQGANATVPARDVGVVFDQNAPNIRGSFMNRRFQGNKDNTYAPVAAADGAALYVSRSATPTGQTTYALGGDAYGADVVHLDASRSNHTYSDTNSWLIPRTVGGVWIIRAKASFDAAHTNFNVIDGLATRPADGTSSRGGKVVSKFKVADKDNVDATLAAQRTFGGEAAAVISVSDYPATGSATSFDYVFPSTGVITLNGMNFKGNYTGATAQMVGYKTNVDGGVKVVATDDIHGSAVKSYYFTGAGDFVCADGGVRTKGGDYVNGGATFKGNVLIDWGNGGHTYQENGDIVQTRGTNSIFTASGSNSLSSFISKAVIEVYLGTQEVHFMGFGSIVHVFDSGRVMTGIEQIDRGAYQTAIQNTFTRPIWCLRGDGSRRIINSI